MKNIPKWAVEHPMLMLTVVMAVGVAGFLVYQTIPQELQPYVENPTVGIVITYPGVVAEDMETYFTRPIEQKMSVITDLRFIRSNSQEGRSEVILGFHYGVDLAARKNDVTTLLTNLFNELPIDPANASYPWVVHVANDNVPILDLSVTSETWDPVRLREFVENVMRDQIEKAPGVQSAIPFGGKRRLILIEVDRDKLAAYGLGIMDIRQAVDRNNLSRSAGRLVARDHEFLVRADARYRTAAELRDLPIASREDRIVVLGDVAQVKDTIAEQRSSYHFSARDGEKVTRRDTNAILMMIVKQPEFSDKTCIEGVLKVVEQIREETPGLDIRIAYNRMDFLDRIIDNAWEELYLAILLTSLVLLLFLERLTPSIIVIVVMPLSVISAFIFFRPFGFSINTPTLMGLTFVIGRLVDDSVVMMDVINRHMKKGKPAKQAAIDGAQELIFATLATSFTFWISLAPNLFLGGSMGTGFRGMTAPMIFANIWSTLFALTLTPLMAAYLWQSGFERKILRPVDLALAWLLTPFRWLINGLERLYRVTLGAALRFRLATLAIAVSIIYVGGSLWSGLPWEGMPLQDTGQAVGEVEVWPGATLEETEKVVQKIEQILLKEPEVRLVSTQIGQEPTFGTFFSGYGMRTVNKAFFKITYTHTDDRIRQFYHKWFGLEKQRSDRDIWAMLDAAWRESKETVPGIRSLWFMEMGATPFNTARAPVEAVYRGEDLDVLDSMGKDALKVAGRTPGLVQPFTSWSKSLPTYKIHIDRRRAQEAGLTVQQIAMQAFYAHQGGMTEQFFKPAEGYRHSRYLIRYREDQRRTKGDLENTLITAPGGRQYRLVDLATIEPTYGVDMIYKEDLQYAMSLLAQYRGLGLKMPTAGLIMGSKTTIPELAGQAKYKGYTVGPKGVMVEMMDNIFRLENGIVFALFSMFVLLLLQSGSFTVAFAILTDIPTQVIGALFFLYMRHFFWSPPVMWGQTIAIAIVVGTGIYLLDKIRQLEAEGMPHREAVIEGGATRLRPVLMTTLTTLMSFVPPMFAPPTGMDRFRPIATGIVGAMVSSTILSLILVPVWYSFLRDAGRFFGRIFKGPNEKTGGPAAAVVAAADDSK